MADLFLLTQQVNGAKRPQPHPAVPFKTGPGRDRERMGDTAGRTRSEVVTILQEFREGRGGVLSE